MPIKWTIWKKLTNSYKGTIAKDWIKDDSTHGHQQKVNTEIRLITFFAAEDGEALATKNKTSNWLQLTLWNPYYKIQTKIEENR